jgi:hypothetical protein
VKFPKQTAVPAPTLAAASRSARGASTSKSSDTAWPTSANQLNDFQMAMISQVVMADSLLLPGRTVASEVSAPASEADAAEYLEQVRQTIEASRRKTAKAGKAASKKAGKTRKAATTKTTKKVAGKKR